MCIFLQVYPDVSMYVFMQRLVGGNRVEVDEESRRKDQSVG